MANYVDYASATELFTDVGNSFTAIEGKIPSNASSSNKMVTASDIASKADLVDGKVPAAQLPSFVDDVLEYASTSAFPATGESGKIYVALDTNKTYRWGGSDYVEISESLALGETSSTAYAGDKGKANADAISDIQDLIPSGATTSNKLATASDIPTVPTTDQTYDATSTNPQSGTAVASAISGKADTSDIPTALSDLTDDSTHRVVTDTEKTTWSGKQDALTFDNAPTANSNNPVKSGGIKTALDDKMSYADNGVLGARNLLKYPYEQSNKEVGGITFTDNGDGSITISGTATADASFVFYGQWASTNTLVGGGDYRVTIENIIPGIKILSVYNTTQISDSVGIVTAPNGISYFVLRVLSGTAISTPITVFPMITLATDTDSTYQPYAMTNRELTEVMTPVDGTITVSEGVTNTEYTYIRKVGKIVNMSLAVNGVTKNAFTTFATIPSGFRPIKMLNVMAVNLADNSLVICTLDSGGAIQSRTNISAANVRLVTTWITS